MILMQPVTFKTWVPYQGVAYYVIECPFWLPDTLSAQTNWFNEACRQHVQAWSYPTV
jgi:hypothetical protein